MGGIKCRHRLMHPADNGLDGMPLITDHTRKEAGRRCNYRRRLRTPGPLSVVPLIADSVFASRGVGGVSAVGVVGVVISLCTVIG